MDRELRVMKNGQVLAELVFDYTRPNTGKVQVLVNRIIEIGDDMFSTYPLWQQEEYISHGDFKSFAECKAFDKNLLGQNSDFLEHVNEALTYSYQPVLFRYSLELRKATFGIAEFITDFDANTKELKFLSARHQKEDWRLETTCMKPNCEILKKMCEDYLNSYGVDIRRVGW